MDSNKKYIEMYWKCPFCGSKDIKGRHRECPNCGRPRSDTTKFYFIEKDKYVDESVVEKGPDWMCDYCESYNPNSAEKCLSCGQPRTSENKDYFDIQNQKSLSKTREHKDSLDNHLDNNLDNELEDTIDDNEETHTNSFFKKSFDWRRLICGTLLIAIISAIISFAFYAIIPKTKEIAVTDKAWTRSIDIEEYKLVEDSDWFVPTNAVEVTDERQEIHHYDKVFDHYESVQRSREVFDGYDVYYTYEDLGNGYGQQVEHKTPRYRTEYYYEQEPVYKDVPVYKTKYYYTIWKWVYEKTLKESGNAAVTPIWPDTSVLSKQEREATKKEQYEVTGLVKGKSKTYKCNYDVYSQMKVDFKYTITVSTNYITNLEE